MRKRTRAEKVGFIVFVFVVLIFGIMTVPDFLFPKPDPASDEIVNISYSDAEKIVVLIIINDGTPALKELPRNSRFGDALGRKMQGQGPVLIPGCDYTLTVASIIDGNRVSVPVRIEVMPEETVIAPEEIPVDANVDIRNTEKENS